MLSLSQFQFPVEEVSSGYSWGDIVASRKVIMLYAFPAKHLSICVSSPSISCIALGVVVGTVRQEIFQGQCKHLLSLWAVIQKQICLLNQPN